MGSATAQAPSRNEPRDDRDSWLTGHSMTQLQALLPLTRADVTWVGSLAGEIFEELRSRTCSERGVTRASWGDGETVAATILKNHANALGLSTSSDAVGNLYVELPGRDPNAKSWITGSHLDSVPEGGNYDGAAGAIAGLLALAILKRTNCQPIRNVCVIGFRGEEASSWFTGHHQNHLGSRAALGVIRERELDEAIHRQSGLSLRDHLLRSGFQLPSDQPVEVLQPNRIHGFVELHIEQGPVLVTENLPVGIVSSIRGSLRIRDAKVIGEYGHSGAVPHYLRKDAVFAAADFAGRCEGLAEEVRSAGGNLDITLGQFSTDSKTHSLTKVSGEVRFSVDARSSSDETLELCRRNFADNAARVATARGVDIQLGAFAKSEPAIMSPWLMSIIEESAKRLDISAMTLPSGAGHDAAEFARLGVPAAMIFVRNDKGSHNPDESMEIADFIDGVLILVNVLFQ